MLTEGTIIEEGVCIRGRGRTLEGILAYPAGHTACSALVVGPHPFLGGELRNNVVNSLAKALASRGAVTLAFNYSGVGTSEGGPADWPAVMSKFWKEGTFQEEEDWVDDAGSAIVSLRQWCDVPPVLLGYSFGCRAVVGHVQGSRAKALVLISPNPKTHALEALSGCPVPLLVIHSDNDFTCTVPEMLTWFESLREPKTRIQLSAGEHFFRGHEVEVANVVLEFLEHHGLLGVEERENRR